MAEFNPGSKVLAVNDGNVVEHTEPTGYRLGRRNGELILQGAYHWIKTQEGEGETEHGFTWKDIETVDLDTATK